MKDLEGSENREPKPKMRKNCYKSINDQGNPRNQKQVFQKNKQWLRVTASNRF